MFTSSADIFRTRQAVHDLVEAAGMHREAMQRLGIAGSDKTTISSILDRGRMSSDSDQDLHSSFLLASATPEEDFEAFIGSTAILLANRLQDGRGEEELVRNFDAFRDHYVLADPPERAAIMNGFRLAEQRGLLKMDAPSATDACLTFSRGDVIATLHGAGEARLLEAVRHDITANEAGVLWDEAASMQSSAENMGFRYLYERPTSMIPSDEAEARLIPWT